jgi:hypothetical protein
MIFGKLALGLMLGFAFETVEATRLLVRERLQSHLKPKCVRSRGRSYSQSILTRMQ